MDRVLPKPMRFIYFFFLMLLLGFVFSVFFVTQLQTDTYFEDATRTFVAYLFSILNALIVCCMIGNQKDFLYLCRVILFCFNSVIGSILIIKLPNVIISLNTLERFYGFSKNPNQLASLLTIIPFVVLYLRLNKHISLVKTVITFVISSTLAWIVQSDALFYSYIFCVGIFFFINIKNIGFEKRIIISTGAIYIFIVYIYDILISYVNDTNQQGNQSETRYILWNKALEASMSSPLIGFGPGSFSGLTAPFQGAESHNTFIDMLTNIGFIGLSVFVLFLTKIFYRLYKNKDVYLILILSSILVFSIFHNVLRHPLFWITIFSLYRKLHIKNNLC